MTEHTHAPRHTIALSGRMAGLALLIVAFAAPGVRGAGIKASMTDPAASGAYLTGASYTFQWTTGTNVTQYRLWVGTSAGAKDIYNQSTGTTTHATVNGLPVNGSTVYVRLNSYIDGIWQYNDYTYNTYTAGEPYALSVAVVGNQGTGVAFGVTVNVVDHFGNAASVTQDTDIILSVATGTGSLGGTLTGTIANGTSAVTLTGLTYDTAESGVSIAATRTSGDALAAATSPTFAVANRVVTKLSIGTIAAQRVGVPFNVTVNALDASDHPANVTADTLVELSIHAGTGALASGAVVGTIPSGSYTTTITGVIYDTVEAGVQLTATDLYPGTLTAGHSAAFNVATGPASELTFTTIPEQNAGVAFDVVVNATDGYGHTSPVTANTGFILSLSAGTGTLGGTLTGTIPAGQSSATVAGVTYDKAEAGVKLTATRTSGDSLSSGVSNGFIVSAGPAAKLVIAAIADQTAGNAFSVTVNSTDQYGQTANVGSSKTVTLSLASGTGTLGGTLTGTLSAGTSSVTINGVTYSKAQPGVRLTASATGLTSGTSNAFTVSAGAVSKLTIDTITSPTAGAAFSVVVRSTDASGNPKNVGVNTTVTLSKATGTGVLGGTLSGTITNGTSSVTIVGVTYTKAEAGVSITATDTAPGALTAGTSNTFTVNSGTPSKLSIPTIATLHAGAAFSVTVNVLDANDNAASVTGDTLITLTKFAGTGTLSGTLTGVVNHGQSSVTITGLTYDKAEAGTLRIRATDTYPGTLAAFTTPTIDVDGGTVTRLVITSTIANQAAGTLAPFTVEARDQYGNPTTVPSDTTVTITRNTGTGTAGGTTTGTITAGTGTASFAAVTYTKAEAGVSLTASAPGLTAGNSNTFDISAGPVAKLAIDTIGAQGVGNAFNVVVRTTDAYGNAKNVGVDTTVSLSKATGTGALGGTLAGTVTNGMASVTIAGVTYDTLETGVSITATDTNPGALTAATSNAFDVGAGSASKLIVSAIADQGTNVGFSVTVTSADAGNNTANVAADTTVTLSKKTGTGNIAGTVTGVMVTGSHSVTISGVKWDTASAGVSLTATDTAPGTLAAGDSNLFVVADRTPTKLQIATLASQGAGVAFSVTINVLDGSDQPAVVTQNTTVTLTLQTGTGVLGGTVAGTLTAGSSTVAISGVTYSKVEAGVVLRATASGGDALTAADSNAFNVTDAPAQMTQPASNGDRLGSTTVTFAWTTGAGVTQYKLDVGTTGVGSSNLFSQNTGTTRTATVSGLPSNGSDVYVRLGSRIGGVWQYVNYVYPACQAGVATGLTVTAIGSQGAGDPFSVTVTAVDALGAAADVAADTNIALTVQTGTGTLGGTTTGTITAGTSAVTINGVTYDTAESGVVLRAARSSGDSLAAANSNAFTVTAGTPTQLLISEPGARQAGVPFSIVVTAADQYGNAGTVSGARTITLTLGSGTGSLNGVKVRDIPDGQSSVTFTGLSFDDISDAKVIHAAVTAGGALTAVDSASITVTAGPASKLAIQTIANPTAGATFSVVVHSHDQYDNDANVLYTTHVTLSVDTGSGTLGGTLTADIPTGQSAVTFPGLTYNLAENGVILKAAASGSFALTEALSNAFDVAEGAPANLSFATLADQQAGVNFNVIIKVTDAAGNQVAYSGGDLALTLSVGTGTGTLSTTSATLHNAETQVTVNLNYDTAEEGVVLHVVSAGNVLTAADSNAFDVSVGPADRLAIDAISDQSLGVAFAVVVYSTDQYGSPAPVAADKPVTLTVKTGTGVLGGTVSGTILAGESSVTISGVTYDTSETGVVLNASAAGLTAGDSNAFDVGVGPPTKLALEAISTPQKAGQAFEVTVKATDAGDNETTATDDIVVTLSRNAGTGSLAEGATTGTITAGSSRVTITGVIYDTKEDNVTLDASATGFVTGTSGSFNVTEGPASKLQIAAITCPGAGEDFDVTVNSVDAYNNASNVLVDTTVTLTVHTGAGSLGGTLVGTVTAGTSAVTLTHLTYDTKENGVVLRATASGGFPLALSDSAAFDVGAGAAAKLRIETITAQRAGVAFDVTVTALDQYDNETNVGGDTGVTLTVKTGTGSVGGVTTGTIASGTSAATISGVTYDTKENDVVLTADDAGALTAGDSNAFNVGAGTAAKLLVGAIAGQKAGVAFNVPVSVLDQYDNSTVVEADKLVTLSLQTGTGTLAGTLTGTITNGTGSVTVSGVTYDVAENGVILTASAPGLTADDSSAFNVSAGPPAELVITAVGNQVAGVTFNVTVNVTDQYGQASNVVADTTIALSVNTGTGTLGGTITGVIAAGTNTVTIAGTTYDEAEAGVVLAATASGGDTLNSGTSAPFNVTAAAPNKLSVNTITTQVAGTAFSVVVDVLDAFDNPSTVSQDTTVTLTLATGTGTLAGTVAGTITTGTSSVTIAGVGYNRAESGVSLTATASGGDALTAATSNTFQVNAGAASKLAVSTITNPYASTAFSVIVVARDDDDNTATVAANTTVTLSLDTGTGVLGGTLVGTLAAGASSVTISGVTYSKAETGVILTATASGGDALTADDSDPFNVLPRSGAMTSPAADGDSLTGPSYTFAWTAGYNVTQYRLWVGTSAGAKDIYNQSIGTATHATVTGLPTDGSNVYVRLNAYTGAAWIYTDYVYPAVLAGTADRLAFTTVPNQGVGVAFSVTVKATDPLGTPCGLSADTTITLELKAGTGTGTLAGLTSPIQLTMATGESSVTFTGLTYDTAESGLILTASATGGDTLADAESNTFSAAHRTADRLAFQTVPSQKLNETFSVNVFAADSSGNPANVSSDTGVTLARVTGTGNLGGTLTGTIADGSSSVTFADLTYDKIEAGVSLSATRTGGMPLTAGTSNTFIVGPATADRLAMAALSDTDKNTAFTVTVTATDPYGNPSSVTQNTTIALTLGAGTGTLSGTLVKTMTAGTSSAVFSGLTYSKAESGVVIHAAASGGQALTAVDSNAFRSRTGLAEMSNPATNGSTLTGSALTFAWTAGTGVTQYKLWVGTTPGGSDLYIQAPGTARTATVTGLPTDGSSIHVRLFSYKALTWQYNDYAYTTYTSGVPTLLALSAIAAQGVGVPFTVRVHVVDSDGGAAPVTQNTGLALSLATGTGVLGGNLTATISAGESSVELPGITYSKAESGVSITATRTSGDVLAADTSNTFSVTTRTATKLAFDIIRDPAVAAPFSVVVRATDNSGNPANVIADTAVTLSRATGTGVLGGTVTGTIAAETDSATISGITYDTAEAGVSLTATRTGGDPLAAGTSNLFDLGIAKAAMTSPTEGSELGGSSVTFAWTAGTGVSQYRLWIGTTLGGNALYNQSTGTNQTVTVGGLPTDGSRLYVRLNSYIGGTWWYNDYLYIASSPAAAPAAMTVPASNGDTLAGSSFTFAWSRGLNVSQYRIWVGTMVGSNNISNQGTSLLQSATVTGLPTDGSTIYVRLFSYLDGAWTYVDYQYVTTNIDHGEATMTTPAVNGATLTGSSYTFAWNMGTNVSQYRLWVGTTLGGTQIYNRSTGLTRSATVTGLPTNGSTIYVRLNSYIGGVWYYRSYQYAAFSGAPQTSPPVLMSAVSRKLHGTVGTFDLDIMDPDAIEPRKGGPTMLVCTFDRPVQGRAGLDASDVAVTLSTGSQPSLTALSIDGGTLTVQLADVPDRAAVGIAFPGIECIGGSDAAGRTLCFRTLLGDVGSDGVVNLSDLLELRDRLNASPDMATYRLDIVADGKLSLTDLLTVRDNLNAKAASPCP